MKRLYVDPQWDYSVITIKNPSYTNRAFDTFSSLDLCFADVDEICKVVLDYDRTYGINSWYRTISDSCYVHDMCKIHKVFREWDAGKPLTPIVFRHDNNNLFLTIHDGNHRFSATTYLYRKKESFQKMPFLIDHKEFQWIQTNIPSVKHIATIM